MLSPPAIWAMGSLWEVMQYKRLQIQQVIKFPYNLLRRYVAMSYRYCRADAEFGLYGKFVKSRNWGFNTVAGNYLIPTNTVVTGSVRITGERMGITINAIQHAGNVIPVKLLVYDLDGGQGIPVPGSEEINAIKEIATNMGSSMGSSSITITDDVGSQLLADLGRSAIQEQVVWPLRAYNNVTLIGGKKAERMVFALSKFAIPDDKHLIIELHEKESKRKTCFVFCRT